MLHLFILLTVSISSDNANNQKNPPTTVLINENTNNFWTPYKIDRTGWKATANSEETTVAGTEGPISNIIDDKSQYIWHSKYINDREGGHDERKAKNDPFQITIDLGKQVTFRAFSYMPRPNSQSGRFGLYDFYVSQTKEELQDKILNDDYVAKGFIDKSAEFSTLVILSTIETGQFIALRSIDPNQHATCAEFNLYRDPPFALTTITLLNESSENIWNSNKIDRSSWSITANSEQTTDQNVEGPVRNIIDGNPSTRWHTRYNQKENGNHDERNYPSDPFYFTVDLKKSTTFEAFSYMPRPDHGNGIFEHFEFYVANTENELKNKFANKQYQATGYINPKANESTLVIFDKPLTGLFVSLHYVDHGEYATCAEFNLYREPFIQSYVVEEEDKFCRSYKIDRSSWSVTANSEQTTDQNVEGIFEMMVLQLVMNLIYMMMCQPYQIHMLMLINQLKTLLLKLLQVKVKTKSKKYHQVILLISI